MWTHASQNDTDQLDLTFLKCSCYVQAASVVIFKPYFSSSLFLSHFALCGHRVDSFLLRSSLPPCFFISLLAQSFLWPPPLGPHRRVLVFPPLRCLKCICYCRLCSTLTPSGCNVASKRLASGWVTLPPQTNDGKQCNVDFFTEAVSFKWVKHWITSPESSTRPLLIPL